jgi:hypothetical protein
MAGIKPSFVTGANAKIKAGDLTIAYAQDVSYNVTVTTIPIETMGRYEVVSNEPVAYFVDGTLSVIRYTDVAAGLDGTAATGNGVGNWKFNNPQGADASQHFNPAEMLASQTWDLEIFQKSDDNGGIKTTRVIKVKDCRLTRKGGGINKRGILVEQYAFNAILADDDSMVADKSGDIDLA